MTLNTGSPRKYPYLHAAVYAGFHKPLICSHCEEGQCTGHHYVIENGGHLGDGIGIISAQPLEKAYEKDAEFFVLSPPKDQEGRSTRYLILERALASLGMYYHFNIRAVSCEVFAMTLLRLQPSFQPLQTTVLKPSKGYPITDKRRLADEQKFMEFHQALCGRIGEVPDRLILSLHYYLDQVQPNPKPDPDKSLIELNANHPCWAAQMEQAYEDFFKAVHE